MSAKAAERLLRTTQKAVHSWLTSNGSEGAADPNCGWVLSWARRLKCTDKGTRGSMLQSAVVLKRFRIPTVGEKSRIMFWVKVGPVRVESPPFALDNDPGFAAESDELLGGTLLGNFRNGIRPLGKIYGETLQIIVNVGVDEVIDDAVSCVQSIDTGVVDLNRGSFIVDKNVVAHCCAPTAMTALHCSAPFIAH